MNKPINSSLAVVPKSVIYTCIISTFLYLLSAGSVHALDLSYGKGKFGFNTSIHPLVSSDISLDTNTWSLSEKHKNIKGSRFYYDFHVDYFDSDTVNKVTDFASLPLTTPLPVFGSSIDSLADQYTQLPIPADYRVHGVNLDMGLGYDLISNSKAILGIGVNTGLSTPFMKVRNMKNTANLVLDVLDTFDTKIKTYKAGVSVHGEYSFNDQFSVTGKSSLNYQTGKLDNDIVGSGISIDGSYHSLDLSLKYQPSSIKNAYVTAGYSYNKWNVDSASVSTPVGGATLPRIMDIDMDTSNLYLGAGYDF